MNSSRTVAVVCAVTLSAWLGCDARRPKKFFSPEDMERYAALPFASATHNAELRAELARVVAEGGTPAQLGGLASPAKPLASGRPDHSIIVELTEIFPADTRDVLAQRLRSVYPDARFQFAPLVRGTARELLQVADERRGKFQRLMLTAPLQPAYPHAFGIGADASYLTAVEMGNRLTGIYIADLLESDRIPQAVESLDAMFRAAEWLVHEKHPLPRIAGAQQRAEALVVLGAIARHPRTSPEIRGQLLELLTRQLSRWPPDADAWIGERAEGLHTYELIRDGYLLSVLPFENLRKLREEIGVDKLGQVIAGHLDADELFFLATMREVIASCSQPFHQRAALFAQIEEDLERLRSSDQYPFVADQLLLLELVSRQQSIALDHARCMSWQIALTVAAGSQPPADTINPLTGEPFSIIRVAGNVSVDGIGADEPAIEVPR